MGVPAFFRWLSRKYPSIVVHATEEGKCQLDDGTQAPNDTSQPNPNEVEFDNLYLDMNGIIHPCTHPEDRPAPRNEEEMMVLIFEYIDRIFNIVRPRRLLYMAIDGVAPRAKMNQQRSRRFRASKEVAEKEEEIQAVKARLLEEGLQVLNKEKAEEGEKFDSNCITPGTQFMDNLAKALRYYIHQRLNTDPGWANISVILSDASVPGEGEHKIMDFIRKQRSCPSHDPNTHHCLCGADADLIMLGLATHEANFTIIREEFKPNAPRPCSLCGQIGHELKYCSGVKAKREGEEEEPTPAPITEFIFLRLPVLREYLAKELEPDRALPYPFDLERAIDDWVFMCFFVGNDFLPHLPSLEIREGAIDRLIDIYKANSDRTGGYLTENGFVDYQRVQVILNELGRMEDVILKNRLSKAKFERRRDRERERAQQKRRQYDEEERAANEPPHKRQRTLQGAFSRSIEGSSDGLFAAVPVNAFSATPAGEYSNVRQAVHQARQSAHQQANMSSAQRLRAMLVNPDAAAAPPADEGGQREEGRRPVEDDNDEDPNDVVRLGEEGWKARYYMNKFGVDIDTDVQFQQQIVQAYVEGLSWVLQYYYQGCPSWTWYYPYHYSPFASDFVHIASLNITFPNDTQPFKPLEQLMAVFPEGSSKFLPSAWRQLMVQPTSPILDFYPSDFCVDLNGKKFAWQGVALLPFVDEERLLKTLATVYDTLTEEEVRRNGRGESLLFTGGQHTVSHSLVESFYRVEKLPDGGWSLLAQEHIYGMAGLVALDEGCFPPGTTVPSPYASLVALEKNAALSVAFRDPLYHAGHRYLASRLPGAQAPPSVLANQGRAQLGFNPNRRQVSLSGTGHRLLNGAAGIPAGRGRGAYQYDNRQPSRRSYNEEVEPRWEDDRRRHSYNAHGNGYQQQRNNNFDNYANHIPDYHDNSRQQQHHQRGSSSSSRYDPYNQGGRGGYNNNYGRGYDNYGRHSQVGGYGGGNGSGGGYYNQEDGRPSSYNGGVSSYGGGRLPHHHNNNYQAASTSYHSPPPNAGPPRYFTPNYRRPN